VTRSDRLLSSRGFFSRAGESLGKNYALHAYATMPLSHAPLSLFADGNLIVGNGAKISLHAATFDEFAYLYAVNDRAYETTMNIVVKNGAYEANLTFYVIPYSNEQLLVDGLPLAPGTSLQFVAPADIAVHGHVLRDL
jgi:hypothetical protein